MALTAMLVTGLLGGPVAMAASLELRDLQEQDPAPVRQVTPKRSDRTDETAGHPWKPQRGDWPQAGTAEGGIPGPGAKARSLKAGSLPLKLTPGPRRARTEAGGPAPAQGSERAQAQVLPRSAAEAAGVDGVLLAVRAEGPKTGTRTGAKTGGKTGTRTGAKTELGLELDYSGFRDLYGGGWASRLALHRLPDCALTTPGKPGCAPGRALPTRNNPHAATLSATVPLTIPGTAEPTPKTGAGRAQAAPPVAPAPAGSAGAARTAPREGTVLLAMAADTSGSAGDFSATPLSPSGKWTAGESGGGFGWSYDLDTPEAPGGLEPELSLGYSSQSIDGRTAATNNQANWAGDGWSLSPGFIERRYTACEDDRKDNGKEGNNPSSKVGDQCWKKDNATLSLGGSSSELVKLKGDGAGSEWRKQDDDGTRVAQLASSERGNGDNNGEYWRVTTPDGIRYYFGYNRLPGWTSGKEETNSVFTAPVFGNHAGEPCHASAFKDSWCQQGWRWNLDYVVDPHANAMAYYWAKESNYYARNVNDTTGKGTPTAYTRGGYLKRAEYGLRSGSVYSEKAAAKADFTVAERCLPTSSFDCATAKFTKANAAKWPDVPFDQHCKKGDDCKGNASPSFWSRKRLTEITSSALVNDAYQKVDSWKLAHSFPSTGDGTAPPLWLKSITRTGHTGSTSLTMPAVTFRGQQLPNRVEGAVDPIPPYNRYRVHAIDTETGGTVGVTYSEPDCKAGSLPKPASNTKRCYPVIWSPPDAPAADWEPYEDWFHAYVADEVIETDNTAGAPAQHTSYTYLGGMAWAKDEDEFTKAKHRTYGDRRGYARVRTVTGTADDTRTRSEARYFRGIDGAKVVDSEGHEVTDRPQFAGQTREEATFDGINGKLTEATSSTPWRSAPTASQTRPGLPALEARHTGVQKESSREVISGGKTRRAETTRTFDSYGMVTSESDTGDTSVNGDEECTRTTYVRNTDKNILDLVAEEKTVATPCGATAKPDDLVSLSRTYFDGADKLDATPTKGDVTRTDETDDKGTGTLTTGTATHDRYGRELTSTDAAGHTSSTAYTPATGQAPAKTVATNALGHTQTTHLDPRRGATTATVDANGKRTDLTYDALGRTTQAWDPGWPKADHAAQPSASFAYAVSKDKPTVVSTKTLRSDGTYASAYAFYDGLLRERESQAPATGSVDGRVVTETLYDTLGRAWKSYSPYYAEGKPSATLVTANDAKIPTSTLTRYDGAGRTVAEIQQKYGDETRRTTTQYDGDRTTVIPPKGGTATTEVTDIHDRVTERLSYTNADRTESVKATTAYGKHGEQTRFTDAAGNTWKWTYDARGRQITADDPDKGVTTTTYDSLDQPVKTTDARGITLTTSYDALGRQTALKEGSTVRAAWSYDKAAKGQPDSETRYDKDAAYTSTVVGYNDRYQPTSTTMKIPSAEGDLAGSYTWKYLYDQATGARTRVDQPAIGGLPAERLATSYTPEGLPKSLSAGGVPLVGKTTYDTLSHPVRTEQGLNGRKVYETRNWDEHTGQLTRATVDGQVALRIEDTRYTYDPAGNTTRVAATSSQDEAATHDVQCFTTDALQRLTAAWTTADPGQSCATAPEKKNVGGSDPYWQSFAYDKAGNRTKETRHALGAAGASAGGEGAADTVRTYAYGTPGGKAPNTLRSVATTGSGEADEYGTETFGHDEAGNTLSRKGGSHDQNMTWDAEGRLETVTEAGATTSYLYTAGGDRLAARNAGAGTTLYLPEGNELTAHDGQISGTRYYTHGDRTIATRVTGQGISYLFSDQQGTAMVAVAFGTSQMVTRRKQLPFGGPRNGAVSGGGKGWPGSRGFAGGKTDPTGTTHLGAREYDPDLGRFLSVDPYLIASDQRQHNPYQYGGNNPATFSDPSGEALMECVSGQYNCSYGRGGRIKKVTFGKNYKKVTRAVGGTISRNYWAQRANKNYRHVYRHGHGTTRPTARQLSRGASYAAAQRRAAVAKAKRRADRNAAKARAKQNQKNEGFWQGVYRKTHLKEIAGAYFSGNTTGVCASGSAGFGTGGSVGLCLVSTRRPDGKTDYGISFSKGLESPSVGANATVGLMGSNADGFDQLRGDGWGGNFAVGAGPAVSVSHERAIGAVNSRGERVGATDISVGAGVGVEAGISTSTNTRVGRLFTLG
ncbi:RHS repeat domain-containing protein [Streptomyces iconiensis]|uniref:RHS repeat-associated core domain-containing protein n=1 Tax=Streptomyces iconiensis TaxID=1384038 RepID=A0ABT7A699_9ACTN|nr:RHS repeat-associated core domain-containing protein [Streptomyces iconiensis]MDJ1136864.1 RHS repeat-associated core domain-containing protein [Streptomyces iconiensis]